VKLASYTERSAPRCACGLSLIELLVFIVVVGVALAGVLSAINVASRGSANPMVRKQALAAAESLLEEIEQHPFTFCDPRDPSAPTATSAAGCSLASFSMDTPANWGSGKTRYGPTFFDNVADYNNFSMNGTLNDVFQQASSRLTGYSASVAITQVGTGFGLANNVDALRIDVTVTGGGDSVTLTGFRFRHSPNLVD
jgi:MSHA pilin protein MshD